MPLQLLARANLFLITDSGGEDRSYSSTSVGSYMGNPAELPQALVEIAQEIRGPVNSMQANEGGEPGTRKIKFLFKCRHL